MANGGDKKIPTPQEVLGAKKAIPKPEDVFKKKDSTNQEGMASASIGSQRQPSLGSQETSTKPDWVVLNVQEAQTAPLENLRDSINYYRDFYGQEGLGSSEVRFNEFNELIDTYNQRARKEAPIKERAAILQSEAYEKYINEAIESGDLISQDFGGDFSNPQKVFQAVAESKAKKINEDNLSQLSVNREYFSGGVPTADPDLKSEEKRIAEITRQEILSTIPEEERTPEQLAKLEDRLFQEADLLINLDPERGSLMGTRKYDSFGSWLSEKGRWGLKTGLNIGGAISSSINDIFVPSEVSDYIPVAIGSTFIQPAALKEKAKELNKTLTQYDGDVLDDLANGRIANVADRTVNMVIESAPYTALAIAAPNPAVAYSVISMVSGNQYYDEVKNQGWFKKLNEWEQLATVSFYGGFESIGEVAGGKVLKQAVKGFLKKETKGQAEKAFKDFAKQYAKSLGLGISEEGIAEGVTGVGQLITEAYAKGEIDNLTIDDLLDTFIRQGTAGALSGGAMTTGPASVAAVISTPKWLGLKKTENELIEKMTESNSIEEKSVYLESIEELQSQQKELVAKQQELAKSMSDEDIDAYMEAVGEFNINQRKYKKLEEEGLENSAAAEILKEKMQNRINEINEITNKYEGDTVQETETFTETEQTPEGEQQKQVTEKQDNGIQERETTEIPSKPEAEPIQEVEGEVRGEQEGTETTTEEGGVETRIVNDSNPINAIQAVSESVGDGTFSQQVEKALKPFTKKGGKVTNRQAKTLSKRAANVKTQEQLDKFINYASKVLENSEFAAIAAKGKAKRNQAKRKYKKGDLGADSGNTMRALRVDPEDLSPQDAERYEAMVGRMNSTTYSPTNSKNIEDIEYFADKYEPSEPTGKTVKGERAMERKEVVTEIFKEEQSNTRDRDVDTDAVQDDIDLMESLTEEELDNLSSNELEKLTTDFVDAKEGFPLSAKSSATLRKIRKNRKAKAVKEAIQIKSFKNLIREYFNPANIGKSVKGKKDRLERILKNVPLNRIDTIIRGAMDKSKPIYKNLIQPISIAYSKYEGAYKTFEKNLDKLIRKAIKSVPRKDRNKVTVKLTLIGLAKQKAMNPNAEELSSVEDYMKAIIEDGKNINDYKDKAELYEEVYNDLKGEDANFDWEKAYNSLTIDEKIAFQFIENHYAKQRDKVEVASARNGEGVILYDFYNPIRVAFTGKGSELDAVINQAKDFSKENVPKSPNLKSRKGSEGQLVFLDFFGNARTTNRSVLRDYYLREPLRDATGVIRSLKEDKSITGDARDFIIALEKTLQDVTQNLFLNTEFEGGKFMEWLRNRGYERDLLSIPRAAVEFASNILHAVVYDDASLRAGTEFVHKNSKKDLMDIATKLGTTQFSRLFMGENTIRAESGGIGNRSLGWWDKQMKNISSAFLSKPDSMVAKRLWLGSFTRNFKDKTGDAFDVDKFLDDPTYSKKYKEAIKESRDEADFKLSQGFATMNPFEGIVASQVNRNDKWWQTADKYMTRFIRFEFQSAVDAINGMLGRNEISPKEATRLMAATALRMAAYQAGLFTLQNAVFGLIEAGLGIEGDREEDDLEKVLKRAKMSFLSTGMSLFLLRRMGNFLRIPLVGAVEFLNYKSGFELGLRDEPDYDSFDDSILYSPAISSFKIGADYRDWYTTLLDFVASGTGPLNKLVKGLGRGIQDVYKGGVVNPLNPDEYLIEPDLKTQDAIDRRQERAILDAMNVLSATSGIPFGRDLINLYSRDVFEDYAKDDKKSKRPTRSTPSRSSTR